MQKRDSHCSPLPVPPQKMERREIERGEAEENLKGEKQEQHPITTPQQLPKTAPLSERVRGRGGEGGGREGWKGGVEGRGGREGKEMGKGAASRPLGPQRDCSKQDISEASLPRREAVNESLASGS